MTTAQCKSSTCPLPFSELEKRLEYPSITSNTTGKTNKSSKLLAASLLYRGWHSHSSFLGRKTSNHACSKPLSPLQTVNTNSWEHRRELPEHSPVLQVSCRRCYCRSLGTDAPGVSWQLCSAELWKISPHPSCSSIKPVISIFPSLQMLDSVSQCHALPARARQELNHHFSVLILKSTKRSRGLE